MVYGPGRGRKAPGRQRQGRRRGANGLVRYRQGWVQLRRADVLGLCRCAAGLGCVDHLTECDADFLTSPQQRLAIARVTLRKKTGQWRKWRCGPEALAGRCATAATQEQAEGRRSN